MTFDPHSELEKSFGDLSPIIAHWGAERPEKRALADGSENLTLGQVSAL